MAISHRRQIIKMIFERILLVLYTAFLACGIAGAEADIGRAAYLLNLTVRQLADNTVYAAKDRNGTSGKRLHTPSFLNGNRGLRCLMWQQRNAKALSECK